MPMGKYDSSCLGKAIPSNPGANGFNERGVFVAGSWLGVRIASVSGLNGTGVVSFSFLIAEFALVGSTSKARLVI